MSFALSDLAELVKMLPTVREFYLIQWYDGAVGKPGWFGSVRLTRTGTGSEHDWYVAAFAVVHRERVKTPEGYT